VGDFTQNSLHWMVVIMILWMPLKWGLITYGNLLQATINFVIIALFVFVILRAAEKMKRKVIIAAAATPAGPTQEDLLIQIRDLLKK
jgi:large conductance mechanosensitive channel